RAERGWVTSTAYFDEAGRPAVNREGVHRQVTETDDRGRVTRASVYDAAGAPVQSATVPPVTTHSYDAWSNATEARHLDAAGNPVTLTFYGSRKETTFSVHGDVVAESWFDPSGRPYSIREGFASATYVRDERGRLVEQTRLGADLKPVEGVAVKRF